MAGPGARVSVRRRGPGWLFLAGLILAVAVFAVACSSPKPSAAPGPATPTGTGLSKAVSPPGTPAGAQLRWLIAATAHLPMSDAQVRAHFDSAFLAQVSPAMLNQALQGASDVRLVSIEVNEPVRSSPSSPSPSRGFRLRSPSTAGG